MRASRYLLIWAVIIGFQVALADVTHASPIVFSGLDTGASVPGANSVAAASSFNVAALGLGTTNIITFEPPLVATNLAASQTLMLASGVSVTGPFIDIRNTLSCAANLCGGPSSGTQFLELVGQTATFSFLNPISAFGAFFGGLQNDNLGVNETLTFFDGSAQTINFPLVSAGTGGFAFIGFTDSGAAITNVTVSVQGSSIGDVISIDDLRVSAIPEPASLVLLGGGLWVLVVVRKLRKSR